MMAADDIFSVQCSFEAPSGNATLQLYYQQTVNTTAVGNTNQLLADAWNTALRPEIRDIMCDDYTFPAILVRKHDGVPMAMRRLDSSANAGLRLGAPLPANNTLLFNLGQGLFPPRSNGRINWPAISESDQVDGVITAAFLTDNVAPLQAKMLLPIAEESAGAGRWSLGVISAKVRDAAPPFKDWAGAFAAVVGISANPVLATQRRRQTKVMGYS